MKKRDQDREPGFSRRELFRRASVMGIAAAGSSTLLYPHASEAAAPQAEPHYAVEALTAQQSGTLSAITKRFIPTDANGPGALEAHAATYVDKSVKAHYSYHKDNHIVNLATVEAYSKATLGASP